MMRIKLLFGALALCLPLCLAAAGAARAAGNGEETRSSPLRELSACLQQQAAAGGYSRDSSDDDLILLIVACQPAADAFTNWCKRSQEPADCAHVIFVTARGVLDALPPAADPG
jgi:hypothetical protein